MGEHKLDEFRHRLIETKKCRRFANRCSEDVMHATLDEVYSVDAMAELAQKYGLCDSCDFSGLNVSVVRILLNCVATVLYKYPRARSKICFLGSKRGYENTLRKLADFDTDVLRDLGLQYICDEGLARAIAQSALSGLPDTREKNGQNTLAFAVMGAGLIDALILDEEDFSTANFKELKQSIERNSLVRHYPVGCTSVAYIIYHELGHLVCDLCGVDHDATILNAFENSSQAQIKNDLSGYAATSVAEYIAEGFAESMASSAPRATARFIVSVIEEDYRALEAQR